jgi:hypothetical protein
VSCAACEDVREKDGEPPECETGEGCKVPPLSARGVRAMELRRRLFALGPLTGPEAVLREYGATKGDLDLLLAAEEELKAQEKEEKGEDG